LPLEKLAKESTLPAARMHALYARQGLKQLSSQTLLGSLKDPSPRVREHAILLAESLIADSKTIRDRLCAMTSDPDPGVQLQLAFTLGEMPANQRDNALADLIKRSADEPLVQAAVLSSLNVGAGHVLEILCQDSEFGRKPSNRLFVQKLAALAARQKGAAELARVENCLASIETEQPLLAASIVRGLATRPTGKRAKGSRELSAEVLRILENILVAARKVAADESQSPEDRVEAIRTLSLGEFAEQQQVLTGLFDNRFPQPIQLAAVETLGSYSDLAVADILLDAWSGMTPRVRTAAADVLFSRPLWTGKLFDSIDAEDIPLTDIEFARIRLAQSSRDRDIRDRAKLLAAKMNVAGRSEVVEKFRSALKMKGNPENGKVLFAKTCSACHQLEGVGNVVGPNLAAFKSRGAEAIYLNVLDPNREVNPQYVSYQVRTHDGKVLTGMIVSENDNAITLVRGDNAQDTLQKSEIEELRSSGQSLMPEGLEKQIDEAGLADVIAYILSTK
jgi:putative heme-binding domain-containing protein